MFNNIIEWDILMASTAEDMTSNTVQQRMIPKKKDKDPGRNFV